MHLVDASDFSEAESEVVTDALGGTFWPGYSFISGMVSDLSAIGSPVREIVVPLFIVYDVLILAFALASGYLLLVENVLCASSGGLLIAYGILNFVGYFTPEHQGETVTTPGNIMHITVTVVTVLLFLLQLGVGAIAFGKRFRIYSIATLLVILALGAYIFTGIGAGQLVTSIGVWERILIYGYMLWVVVLSIVLLRAEKRGQAQLAAAMPNEAL